MRFFVISGKLVNLYNLENPFNTYSKFDQLDGVDPYTRHMSEVYTSESIDAYNKSYGNSLTFKTKIAQKDKYNKISLCTADRKSCNTKAT